MTRHRTKSSGGYSSRHATRASKEESKPTRYYSSKQEKTVASHLGGERTSNSGATPFQKSDVLTEQFALECKTKTTQVDSISIKKEWLEKNEKEAMFMGKQYSALAFNFGPNQPNYYIIDEHLFQDLLDYLK